jgi:NADPH:quinone reductase-like Zn-dependent oxidoreductase
MSDLPVRLEVLEEGKTEPVIAETFPFPKAAKSDELLENGRVIGHAVWLAPGLLKDHDCF